MALIDRKVTRRLSLGVLILILSLSALSAILGQGTAAAAQTAGALRVMGGCEPVECNAQAANRSPWRPAMKLRSDVLPIAPAQAASVGAAALEDEVDSPAVMVWSAMMTVGKSEIASIGYLGFVTGDWPDTGSVDSVAFTLDGADYVITALYHPIVIGDPNHLFLHLNRRLAGDLTLRVGPDAFDLSDADVLGTKRNIYHWYLDAQLGWEAGESIPVSLTAPERENNMQRTLVRELAGPNG